MLEEKRCRELSLAEVAQEDAPKMRRNILRCWRERGLR